MRFERDFLLIISVGVLTALGGCVSTRGHLTSSAHELEYHAHVLAQDAGPAPPEPGSAYPAYSRDAAALAENARELSLAAQGSSDMDVKVAFDRVSRSYHAVRDEVEHSENLQARNDLVPVTEAYRNVENDLGYPAREASANYHVPEDR
jgi:hypothetical protein